MLVTLRHIQKQQILKSIGHRKVYHGCCCFSRNRYWQTVIIKTDNAPYFLGFFSRLN